MNDDYLWDRTGPPDGEVERLEQLLGSLRHKSVPLAVRQIDPAAVRAPWARHLIPWALAAGVFLLVAGTWTTVRQPSGLWVAEALDGTPTSAARELRHEIPVGIGQLVETDGRSSVRLTAREVGEVEVGPGSRLRVVDASPDRQRFVLERGRLDATIWAPPGRFAVQTPWATALDLGCRYSLEVDADGAGLLRVSAGWVGLERDGREAFVPEGASCATVPGRGPGIPHRDDASPEFVRALAILDAGAADGREAALRLVLTEARPRDALSLWHLLTRLPRQEAAPVYDRLAATVPPPAAASRERVLAREADALDAWWDALGLGPVRLFRTFMAR
jgi:hypothetical protein